MAQSGFVGICTGSDPTCFVDADNDGMADVFDRCTASKTEPTVVIDGHDTGVRNGVDPTGCTLSDRIEAIATNARNGGQLVSGLRRLMNDLRRQNAITDRDMNALLVAAGAIGKR